MIIDGYNVLDLITYDKIPQLKKMVKSALDINPHKKGGENYNMWKEQCHINFPILFVASLYLYLYAHERNCSTFLFASRDCCHWYKIFKALFPHVKSHYLNCSRIMFQRATDKKHDDYNDYIKSLVGNIKLKNVIYIDVHGTGERMFNYFSKNFKDVPYCFLLSATCIDYNDFPDNCLDFIKDKRLCNLVFDARGSPIEMLNYDLVGTLQNYSKKKGAIRDDLEYKKKLIQCYHDPINQMVSLIKPIDDIHKCQLDLKLLNDMVNKLYKVILNDKPCIEKHIEHIGRHKKKK